MDYFEMLKPMVTGLVRHILTFVGTWLVTTGLLTEEQSGNLVLGLAALIISLVSMLISKYWQEKKVEVALEMPANSSKEKLAQELKLK